MENEIKNRKTSKNAFVIQNAKSGVSSGRITEVSVYPYKSDVVRKDATIALMGAVIFVMPCSAAPFISGKFLESPPAEHKTIIALER